MTNLNILFKIVSKMQIGNETKQEATYQEQWDSKIKSTLDKLRLENIDSLLIHNPQDIKGDIKRYLWESEPIIPDFNL